MSGMLNMLLGSSGDIPIGGIMTFSSVSNGRDGGCIVMLGGSDTAITTLWDFSSATGSCTSPTFAYSNGWTPNAPILAGTYSIQVSETGGFPNTFSVNSTGTGTTNWATLAARTSADSILINGQTFATFNGGNVINYNDNDSGISWSRNANSLTIKYYMVNRNGAHTNYCIVTRTA